MAEAPRAWIILPFHGRLVERTLVPMLQEALFKGHVDQLNALTWHSGHLGDR